MDDKNACIKGVHNHPPKHHVAELEFMKSQLLLAALENPELDAGDLVNQGCDYLSEGVAFDNKESVRKSLVQARSKVSKPKKPKNESNPLKRMRFDAETEDEDDYKSPKIKMEHDVSCIFPLFNNGLSMVKVESPFQPTNVHQQPKPVPEHNLLQPNILSTLTNPWMGLEDPMTMLWANMLNPVNGMDVLSTIAALSKQTAPVAPINHNLVNHHMPKEATMAAPVLMKESMPTMANIQTSPSVPSASLMMPIKPIMKDSSCQTAEEIHVSQCLTSGCGCRVVRVCCCEDGVCRSRRTATC